MTFVYKLASTAIVTFMLGMVAWADGGSFKAGDIVMFTHQPPDSGAYGSVVEVLTDGAVRVEWQDKTHKGLPATTEKPENLIAEKRGCLGKFCKELKLIYNWMPPSRATVEYVFENNDIYITVQHPSDPKLLATVVYTPEMQSKNNPNGEPWFAFPENCQDSYCEGDHAFMIYPNPVPLTILEMFSDGHVYVKWNGDHAQFPNSWLRTSNLAKTEEEAKKAAH